MSFYDAIRVGASGASDYEVERSLRFNSGDSVLKEHLKEIEQHGLFYFWAKISDDDLIK